MARPDRARAGHRPYRIPDPAYHTMILWY